jgi:mannose-6-phosphate isomerase-like protein (cupin superfamily)
VATHVPASVVDEQFRTGGLLVDTPQYKVDAGRRTGPGATEVHADAADVIRVVAGEATVDAGGAVHELTPGDVLVVPAGVPHTFVASSDPFLYYVVKTAG